METPRVDRDMGGRVDGAGRSLPWRSRGDKTVKLGGIADRDSDALDGQRAYVEEIERRRSSPFASSPAVEKQELPRLGNE